MTALEVAQRYLDALGGDAPDAVADLVSEDFVNEHQNALGSGCVGQDEYRRRLPGFFASFPGRRYEIRRITTGSTDADGVTDVVAKYTFHTQTPRGPVEIPGVMWIEVRDGRVIRRVDTWDSMLWFERSGDDPPGYHRAEPVV